MKNNQFFYKIGILVSAITCVSVQQSYGQSLQPSSEPIFSTPQAKPNIHLILDDSGSMKKNSDILSADGKKKIKRSEALAYAFENLFYKYREKAYLGVSFLRQGNDKQGMIRLPIGDFSGLSEKDFKSQVIDPTKKLILNAPGHTPMYAAVYEAFKMFRGYPVMQGFHGNAWRNHKNSDIKPKPVGKKNERYFPGVQLETPLRYRCQANHMILMTDGEPYGFDAWGIASEDRKSFDAWSAYLGDKVNDRHYNGVELTYDVSFEKGGVKNRKILGELIAKADLRYAQKKTYKNQKWQEKLLDDAGRSWTDALSVKMLLTLHSVSLYVPIKSQVYLDLTTASQGMNLGVEAKKNGSAQDLLEAFDTIFASIIKSTSSSFAKNDKIYADVLEGPPPKKDGKVDLSKVGAIRYDTIYNFRQRFGNLRAVVPYKVSESLPNGQQTTKIHTETIWDTDQTIQSKQGRYITFLDKKNNGLELDMLNSSATRRRFTEILKQNDPKAVYDDKYIQWLTDFEKSSNQGLRGRLKPMGSITNSDIQIVNKDVLHINVVPKMMSAGLSKELVNFLLYKSNFQYQNYLIVADNDGFINFINAERGLINGRKGGERDTAYFPQLLAKKLPDITQPNKNAFLVLEGKTRIVDGKVYQSGIGNIYATVGLTSMGTGGHGIVGYRLFGASEKSVKDWSASKVNVNSNREIMAQVTPLFEIDGQDKNSGYELGYTYSDFEVFNRVIHKNGLDIGQLVAVFGNGMADNSKIYFMDAYTGEKLHTISLPGIAAMNISAHVRNDINGKGQMLDRLYVTDYTGSIYRLVFTGNDFTDDAKTEITHLFRTPTYANKKYQSAITVKPLVIKNESGGFGIYFGSGVANNAQRDRGENAAVEHAIYGIIDRNKKNAGSTASVNDVKNGYRLAPLLSTHDLNVGKVNYKDGTTIDYTETVVQDLNITPPVEENGQGGPAKKDGWYMRLIADGKTSGERVIQSPKYDQINRAAVFVTWGISERELNYKNNGLYDPCLADLAFGKTLAFDIATGKIGKTPSTGKGQTNNSSGMPTGDLITDSPSSNSQTDITQLANDILQELEEITGKENSTYATEEDSNAAYCTTSINGDITCEEDDREYRKEVRFKGRVNIQKHF